MIGKLSGRIDHVDSDHLILDVGGVGYLVFASQRVLAQCEVGQAMSLMIETHVREDHIHLYGFTSAQEKEWFGVLTSVQGVGVRMALAIMGLYEAAQLQTIIAAEDKTALTAVSGVGPKLATRIVTELKNKVGKLGSASEAVVLKHPAATKQASKTPSVSEDAVSALVNLGYSRVDAFSAVARAQYEGEEGLDALIKAGLKELAG